MSHVRSFQKFPLLPFRGRIAGIDTLLLTPGAAKKLDKFGSTARSEFAQFAGTMLQQCQVTPAPGKSGGSIVYTTMRELPGIVNLYAPHSALALEMLTQIIFDSDVREGTTFTQVQRMVATQQPAWLIAVLPPQARIGAPVNGPLGVTAMLSERLFLDVAPSALPLPPQDLNQSAARFLPLPRPTAASVTQIQISHLSGCLWTDEWRPHTAARVTLHEASHVGRYGQFCRWLDAQEQLPPAERSAVIQTLGRIDTDGHVMMPVGFQSLWKEICGHYATMQYACVLDKIECMSHQESGEEIVWSQQHHTELLRDPRYASMLQCLGISLPAEIPDALRRSTVNTIIDMVG